MHRGVGELLLLGYDLRHAARHQIDPSSRAHPAAAVRAGPSSGSADERIASGEPSTVHFSRQDDELRALGRGPANEALGNLQVAVVFVSGVELYGGGAHYSPPTPCPTFRCVLGFG